MHAHASRLILNEHFKFNNTIVQYYNPTCPLGSGYCILEITYYYIWRAKSQSGLSKRKFNCVELPEMPRNVLKNIPPPPPQKKCLMIMHFWMFGSGMLWKEFRSYSNCRGVQPMDLWVRPLWFLALDITNGQGIQCKLKLRATVVQGYSRL